MIVCAVGQGSRQFRVRKRSSDRNDSSRATASLNTDPTRSSRDIRWNTSSDIQPVALLLSVQQRELTKVYACEFRGFETGVTRLEAKAEGSTKCMALIQ